MTRKAPLTPKQARAAIDRAQTMSDGPTAPDAFRGKRQLLFEALLAGCTVGEAAKKAGYNRAAVYRVVAEPAFRAALSTARSERVVAAQEMVAELVPLAIRRLGGVLRDPLAKDSDVISAAREVLDRGGMPKTERIEVADSAPTAEDADALLEELRAELAPLRLVPSGRA